MHAQSLATVFGPGWFKLGLVRLGVDHGHVAHRHSRRHRVAVSRISYL
jgi:hypothetical protein